ncbi:MAG: YggT family protein [Deltaproteobacteria bacterium]|nr:YggT family protein [Deltaproteobacteria bacterium]
MFLVSNLLNATAIVLDMILTVYFWMIIIRALLSWVNPDPNSPIVRFLKSATDPVLQPVQRWIYYRLGLRLGGMDLSPIVVIMAIYFAQAFLVKSLQDLAMRLG